jgi:hypothetical protein
VLTALVSIGAMPPPALVPKAALTEATMQAAAITYSNDTTPSLSVRRRFNAPVDLT